MAVFLTRKEIADKIRLEILSMSDEDLSAIQLEAFGDGFKTVTEYLADIADKCRKSIPF